MLQEKAPKNATGKLVRAVELMEGRDIKMWVVGKYDLEVNMSMPPKCDAIVFSTPNPIDERKRPDVNNVDGM